MSSEEPTRFHEGPSSLGAELAAPGGGGDLIGRVLEDAYRLEVKVGEGGMGVVYKATQLALRRPVAIKMMHAGTQVPPTAVDRFNREAQLLCQLQHPNIVQIIDFGCAPGPIYFMVMEYLAGESLETYVHSRKRLERHSVLELFEQICAAVTVAHEHKVIHRDLKPSNIFIIQVTGSQRPIVKVLDFGLGKFLAGKDAGKDPRRSGLTQEGMMMGTCGYSAPEQMHGGEVDHRADIYSLGAVLYYLLAGRPPYNEDGVRSTLMKQLTHPPDPLGISEVELPQARAVEAIIHKAMSLRPEDRFASAGEMYSVLDSVLRPGDTIPERAAAVSWLTPKPASSPPLLVSRRGLLFGGAATLAAATAGMTGWWFWPRSGPPLKFGLSGPFSGPNLELGRSIDMGIRTLFRHVNEQGGVHGRPLELIALDDGYEPERMRANVDKLLEEHQVFALIGLVGTPTTVQSLPLILENKRVLFGPYTGGRAFRKDPPDRYVFNYRASYAEETHAIVGYLTDIRRIPPDAIAVFGQNDTFGQDGFHGVERALRPMGISAQKIPRVSYERNKIDVQAAVDTILQAGARVKAVVMVGTYKPAAEFIRKVKDARPDMIFANVSFVGSRALAESLMEMGARYADGVVVTQVVPLPSSNASGVLRFREHLQKEFPQEQPGFISLEGYVAAQILVEGLKKAGRKPTSETLVEGLESIRDLDLALGTTITFGPSDHQGSHKVWGSVLDDKGVFHDLELT